MCSQHIHSFFYFFFKIFIFPVIRLLWVGKVEGKDNIPLKGGVTIASNHESYFDFICLSAVFPRPIYFLTAEVFFKKWWWYPIVKLTGQIKIDRYGEGRKASARKAFEKALLVLKQGGVFGLYPEGTRSSDGKLQKAFTGVARTALIAKVPVVPVGMIGTYEIMSRHENHPHFKKCQIKIGQPLEFSQYYGQENDRVILRKITSQIMLAIADLTGEKYEFD